jgi:hypothetical protein
MDLFIPTSSILVHMMYGKKAHKTMISRHRLRPIVTQIFRKNILPGRVRGCLRFLRRKLLPQSGNMQRAEG